MKKGRTISPALLFRVCATQSGVRAGSRDSRERPEQTNLTRVDHLDGALVVADFVVAAAVRVDETPEREVRTSVLHRISPGRAVLHMKNDGTRIGHRRVLDPVSVQTHG